MAGSIDLVVQVALERDGVRRVREIVAVPGRVEGDVIEIADIFTSRGGRLVRAEGFLPHVDRFERTALSTGSSDRGQAKRQMRKVSRCNPI